MTEYTIVIETIVFWEEKLRKIQRAAKSHGVKVVGFNLIAGLVYKDLEVIVMGHSRDIEKLVEEIQ